MLENFEKIYLDSPVYIYSIEAENRFGNISQKIFKFIQNKKKELIGSPLLLTEIITKPHMKKDPYGIKFSKKAFLNSPNLSIVNFGTKQAEYASELKAKYNLKTPDAIHISTAILAKCDVFITNDKDIKIKEVKVLYLDEIKI